MKPKSGNSPLHATSRSSRDMGSHDYLSVLAGTYCKTAISRYCFHKGAHYVDRALCITLGSNGLIAMLTIGLATDISAVG